MTSIPTKIVNNFPNKPLSFMFGNQLTITCSKSTKGTLEKGVKYVQNITMKTPEQRHWRLSGVFIVVNFEHISHVFLVFLFLTLNK